MIVAFEDAPFAGAYLIFAGCLFAIVTGAVVWMAWWDRRQEMDVDPPLPAPPPARPLPPVDRPRLRRFVCTRCGGDELGALIHATEEGDR